MDVVVPFYYQIKRTIKSWIINGEFNPRDRIPSENELAERFKVSRLTVRRAIGELTQEGFLIARRGGGTFVRDNEKLINRFALEFSGFVDDLFYEVSKTTTQSVEIARTSVSKSIREKLKLRKDEEELIEIKRVRLKGDISFAYTVNYLPLEIGRRIREAELYKKPLLWILEKDLGIRFTGAFQTIEASFADQDLAEKLKIVIGSPMLFIERTMYTRGEKPVELVQSSYRGDFFKYTARLRNVKRGGRSLWIPQGT